MGSLLRQVVLFAACLGVSALGTVSAKAQCTGESSRSTAPITLGLSINSILKNPSPREVAAVKNAFMAIPPASDTVYLKRIVFMLAALDEKERAWEGSQLGFAYFLLDATLSLVTDDHERTEASEFRRAALGKFFSQLACVRVIPTGSQDQRSVRVQIQTIRGETIKLRQDWEGTHVSLDIVNGTTVEIASPSRAEILEMTRPKGRFYFSKNIASATADSRREPLADPLKDDEVIGTSSEAAARLSADVERWLSEPAAPGVLPARIVRFSGIQGDLAGPNVSVPGQLRVDRLLILPGVSLPEALLGPTDFAAIASATVKWKFVRLASARAGL